MLKFVVLSVLVLCAVAERKHNAKPIMHVVNKLEPTTWTAGPNKFEGTPISSIKAMMGVREEEKEKIKALPVHDPTPSNGLPESFDAREQWPECADVISNVRDQSACGSCWAVAAAGAMSDRICINSKGMDKTSISARDLMSCCWSCGFGCNGGYPSAAWSHFKSTGLVSGSNYTLSKGCLPYPLAPCEHHNTHTTYPACPKQEYDTPKCVSKCQDGYSTQYDDDKHKGQSSYSVRNSVNAIKQEIFDNGPVEASFTVYEDFLTYTSGVYQHRTGPYDGGHAVRIIGWGVEDGTPYWLVVNSWNSDWGDQGYFKIISGQNECGIEAGIVAGKI